MSEPTSPDERIRRVAAELRTMSHTAPRGSLRRILRQGSDDLNSALRDLGFRSAESEVDGAERGLAALGVTDVDRLLLGLVLEARPEIRAAADDADWATPEVADLLLMHLIQALLGITEEDYLRSERFAMLNEFWMRHDEQPWLWDSWKL